MKRNIFKTILLSACILQGGSALAQQEKAEPGKFSPTWESLSQYEVPEWFRNAKFGTAALCPVCFFFGPFRLSTTYDASRPRKNN